MAGVLPIEGELEGVLKNQKIMKKKQYIAPEVELVELEMVEILAASIRIGEGEKNAEESFSNDRRGGWGNLWGDEE